MRVNLIPMAGEGQRYKNAGYTIPKPLIDISGVPMFVRAARSLPSGDKYIFVCRQSHLDMSRAAIEIKRYFPNSIIIPVEKLTEGQAITCMLAVDNIPADASLTIGASDCDMIYSDNKSEEYFSDPSIDGWIWTFRNNPIVLQNPKMYGWVEVGGTNNAIKVSCKVPISENPLNDHAVIGAFTFKKAKYFFDAVNAMCAAKDRINNEFYVDVAINYAITSGLNIRVLEVDKYICWGTPQDFELYQYWRGYFEKRMG